jgi:GNAT superfamily N-acetyltransferase
MGYFNRATIGTRVVTERYDWQPRPMEKKDDADYKELLVSEPNEGWINIEVKLRADQSPYELLTQRRVQQVYVVEVPPGFPDAGKVVGVGAADPRNIWFDGQPVKAAHMHNLLVHPEWRHKGVATALIQARINWARETISPNVTIFAELDQNDKAAFNAAAKWATDFTQPRESGFLLAREKAPENPDGYVVHEAREEDYPAIVAGLNTFNHDVDFTRVVDSDRLHRNLAPINGRVFRHRYVVEHKGEIVGGAVLTETDPSVESHVISGRPFNVLVARLTGMIDKGGEVHYGEVDGIWFKPGAEDAAHYLIQTLLHEAKLNKNTTDALNFTVINPKVWEAVQLPRWQPHSIRCVAYLRPPQLEIVPNVKYKPAWIEEEPVEHAGH